MGNLMALFVMVVVWFWGPMIISVLYSAFIAIVDAERERVLTKKWVEETQDMERAERMRLIDKWSAEEQRRHGWKRCIYPTRL